MVLKEKTSNNNSFKINLLKSNTNYMHRGNSNSNSNSNSLPYSVKGSDRAFSLKSLKFSRQISKSGKMLQYDKIGYYTQNSHLSYKSISSNKNSVITFHNSAMIRDKESNDIGSSILQVILI